jgi:hypothetical protein
MTLISRNQIKKLTSVKLEELNMYRISMDIGTMAWNAVSSFPNFAKDTTGKQLVRAADSVSANISEGEGS